jgi:hypothetical protein
MNAIGLISLCYYDGKYYHALADVDENNNIAPRPPFQVKKYKEYEVSNAEIAKKQEKDTVGIWELKGISLKKYSSREALGKRWIEYIKLKNARNMETLRPELLYGTSFKFEADHDYLIEIRKDSIERKMQCVFCKAEDFVARGEKVFLKDTVCSLPIYEIDYGDIASNKTIPQLKERMFYLSLILPKAEGKMFLRIPQEILKIALREASARLGAAGIESAGQAVEILRDNADAVIEKLAKEGGFTLKEASEFLGEIIKNHERYFFLKDLPDKQPAGSAAIEEAAKSGDAEEEQESAPDDADLADENSEKAALDEIGDRIAQEEARLAEVIKAKSAAESDLTALQFKYDELKKAHESAEAEIKAKKAKKAKTGKSKGSLSTSWRNKQNDIVMIADAEVELDEIASRVEEEEERLAEALQAKSDAEDEVAALRRKRDELARVSESLDQEIKEKRERLSGENAPIVMLRQSDYVSPDYVSGIKFSEQAKKIGADALMGCLSENLEAIGIPQNRAKAAGAFLLSAYFQNIPLIIAGFGAVSIVDALSATLFNMTADRVYVSEKGNVKIPDRNNAMAAFDAFGNMNMIIENANNRFVCFISQTSEELAIERRGAYNYALPILAEHLVLDKSKCANLDGFVFQGDIAVDLSQARKSRIKDGILLPLAKKCLDCLVIGAYFFYPEMSAFEEILISCVPALVSLSKKDNLRELASTLGASERKELSLLIGEPL